MFPKLAKLAQLVKAILPYLLVLLPAVAGGYGLHAWRSPKQVDPPVVSASPLAYWQHLAAQGPAGPVQFITAPGDVAGTEALIFPDAVYSLTPIGVTPPTPPGPIPPGPTPPGPNPLPVPTAGLRVLFMESEADRQTLPAGQQEILFSTAPGSVRDYAAKTCVVGPDGKTPEFRVFDKNQKVDREPKLWQDARAEFDRRQIPTPGWIVTNGTSGVAGPLPATSADALAVLKKYGGSK